MQTKSDFLVIGGGIAGLSFALELAELGTVNVLSKKQNSESSTAYAQGGIAAVQTSGNAAEDRDSFALHTADTLIAGAGLCQPEVVEMVVSEGPACVEKLITRGANFDRNPDSKNHYSLHQEGGHSARRILHSADATGWEIQRSLLAACREVPNITFFENFSAIDFITTGDPSKSEQEQQVSGVYVLNASDINNLKVEIFTASQYLLSTGGAGKIYLYTSNPDVATGDGIAMAYRAGLAVTNMEFFQFHPTCLYHPQAKSFLITEAMRGEGALLRNLTGERFMLKHHPELAELAPRDIVARAIDYEMKESGADHIYLDITHLPANKIISCFPTIYRYCKTLGIDITKDQIPVVPAAHYCCGGVHSDINGQTALKNLFVAGETAHTGLHGANRLASNSLLEGLVFAERAAAVARTQFLKSEQAPVRQLAAWDSGSATSSDEAVIIAQNWAEIRQFMWNYVGIVRSDKRLARALKRSELIEEEIKNYYWQNQITPDLLELRNLSLVANLVIRSALMRKESRGLHYSLDYPETKEDLARDTVIYPPVS